MPTTSSIWTSEAARARLLALYDARLDNLDERVERRWVATGFGETHVLLAGAPERPALVVIHGANGDAGQMANAYIDLADDFHCVFVDVPGEPNYSEGQRIARGDDSLARWLGELLDGLGLAARGGDRVALLGMSGGAYTALRSALGLRDRVACVVGLVPEGFCQLGELPPTTPDHAAAFVAATTSPDGGFPRPVLELMTRAAALSFAAVREPIHLGPLFTAADFAGFEVPVLLIAGGRDRLFPGRRVLARARAIVPRLTTRLIATANHVDLRLFRGPELDAIAAFLAEHTGC